MLPVLKYNGKEIAKNIEFANTKLHQMLGLMFRKSIPPDYSMIFILKKTSYVNVHMLFMRFPIDVIFLDEEKKIAGLARLNLWAGFKAMKNIKYVLEMKSETIERYNLSIGGQMEFEEIS
ncbi:MAG: DUF192 domain-containing protein [Candidatus Methanoperedenaceae archaeon]|nr:DUF192 domain-containing protein [Euryarchaeota archaeon]MCG2727134.1 DUF192 domain-containing protein [Candidatus Methanoperedenaceae archaeon]